VLVLTEVHGLTTTQIAERLNISVPAVKSRLSRARRELRRRVETHGGRMGLATLVSQRAWAGGTRP
jgi:DNA-directed RNA polymerase specialized sigma24 family protein